ncbi:Fur family transcriptional regulator [Brachybacterium fresconis]|uniref:Fur family ferric uptake transcriptional regulator n=1 Tax=Brachybacterium fresconis TaxID=173363 RepID=A0ABS4YJF7_9MICO|nr:Fur family transcriptional regulator [Brachybacterium fresconis]MBP2408720.1 Fur family ferric uptake transcriptional regulator [Brachybacterium fresconis]
MPSIDHTSALRGAGLRVTAPRLATLDAVAAHPHADAEVIARQVRERLGTVSRQAVYDVLNALSDAELLRRVSLGGRSMQYELHRHDNHHHLVCRECGRLEDVPCAIGEAPCLIPHDDHGFEIEIADVVYRGVCSECRAAKTASSATPAAVPTGAPAPSETTAHRTPETP